MNAAVFSLGDTQGHFSSCYLSEHVQHHAQIVFRLQPNHVVRDMLFLTAGRRERTPVQ